MPITENDLQDWNSHPVTRAIFKEIDEQLVELDEESTLRPTADQTAMDTAKKEGVKQGANSLKEAYELMMESAE